MGVSGVAGGRSIAYSADSAGRAGRIACQVIRSDSLDDGRISYAIAIRNDTGSDAQASASVPDALHLRNRTIVQSIISAHSQFSTAVELQVEGVGEIPELHVQLSGEDIDFALIVPNASVASGPETAGPRLALTAQARAIASGQRTPTADSHRIVVLRAVPRPTVRRDSPATPSPDLGRRAGERIAVVATQNSPSALPVLVAFVAIVLVIGVAVFRPQINQLTVPPQAQPATSVLVSYRATGLGNVAYRVLGPDGNPLALGSLATGAGTFAITLPKDRGDRAYLVRVAISGILGSASAEDYVRVAAAAALPTAAPVAPAAPRPLPPPQIRSLALDRATLNGGDTLNVYYDVAAASGTIALLDAASQITYGKANLSASGHTAFVIPNMPSERFLTVVLTAQRGAASTQSRVAVTAQPAPSPTPQADASDPGLPSTSSTVMALPIIDTPASVRSAHAFQVDIHDAVAGLVLVLSDDTGSELARRQIEVSSARTSVTFTAPVVNARARVRLEATYPEGVGSETIVKTIAVTPR